MKNHRGSAYHASVHPTVAPGDHSAAHSSTPTIIRVSMHGTVPTKYEEFPQTITIGDNKVHDIQDATEYEESAMSISEVEKR